MTTFFDALESALRGAAAYNQVDQVAPVAVLWTDRERQWEPLLPRLRESLPVLTLGDYDPGTHTGPAIWIRCLVDRELPEADWPLEAVPIIYLPGVARRELRAGDGCPRTLQPLVDLQYRGVSWSGKQGRDWTISKFLKEAANVEVVQDAATSAALARALDVLADERLSSLRQASPLKASFLDFLVDSNVHPDLVRSVLLWLNDPAAEQARRSPTEWEAFRALCRDRFGFDPVSDGPVTAGALLGEREGSWLTLWDRFADAPGRFPNIPDLLRRARPAQSSGMFVQRSSWPQDNEAEESALRDTLQGLANVTPAAIRDALAKADQRHGERRLWVWSDLGHSPLARLLPALQHLAEATVEPLAGSTLHGTAQAYADTGWRADAALLAVLASVDRPADVSVVRPVADALYRPWARASAEQFQSLVASAGYAEQMPGSDSAHPKAGRCTLFADGLRFDVARLLQEELEQRGLVVALDWQFAALPTVTSTTKPWVSPVASLFKAGPEFTPVGPSGSRADAPMLRKLLEESGHAVLGDQDAGVPAGAGWTEYGHLDALGHAEGWRLAYRVREEVRSLAERIRGLAEAGWQEVRVVTDHGWLLLPSAMSKEDLPEHLTEKRKGRCARLKPDALTALPTVPWRWDPTVRIAVAPGLSCFVEGKEYEHGGVSPQECVIPVLSITKTSAAVPVNIAKVSWRGLRCEVVLAAAMPGVTVDLRTKAGDPSSSLVAAPKAIRDDGRASLACEDDSKQGTAAFVVVLAACGAEVLAQALTTVGE